MNEFTMVTLCRSTMVTTLTNGSNGRGMSSLRPTSFSERLSRRCVVAGGLASSRVPSVEAVHGMTNPKSGIDPNDLKVVHKVILIHREFTNPTSCSDSAIHHPFIQHGSTEQRS